jgi:hypothetical protein
MNDSIDETLIRFLASMQQSGAAWSPWLYELGTIVRDVKQLASSELTPRAAEIVRKLDTDLLDTQTELSVAGGAGS